MYCPRCSQAYSTAETWFCSNCGSRLINNAESGNEFVETKLKPSPRTKGTRQGIFFIALSVILIPAYVLLAPLFPGHDRLVESAVSDTPFEKISLTLIITFFLVGLMRLLYARFFESAQDQSVPFSKPVLDDGPPLKYALPSAQDPSISGFGAWRANTGELAKTPDVNERTTRSLDDD
jgi:hypothetical protein